ncbi:hypothetical protein C0993_002463 [Termitomyces sp. T159_Od127]|nr:hypothetical protein C0993_002463 [Termitomyces sp. T159_Od127]
MAYHFLTLAAKKRTEYLVIEVGVDAEGAAKMDLSEELLGLLQRNVPLRTLTRNRRLQSPKVRSSYIEQLRDLNVVVAYSIPTILTLLRLDQGPHKAFKPDIWAVDEFHIEYYQVGTEFGLPMLAAHLYYRALLTVPSLIHTYTSQFFSPVIIRTELTHVKSPKSTANLVDENFTVKVASSVNEVVASYSVDEHQLEIELKIPVDWPLHKIEIKDLRRALWNLEDTYRDWSEVLDDENLPVLTEQEVLRNLQAIVTDADQVNRSEIARGLACDRHNASCLEIVDDAMFVVCLDDATPVNLADMCSNHLCGTYALETGEQVGTCINRWYDKLQIIICADGSAGINFEHTGVDGHCSTDGNFAADIYTEGLMLLARSRNPLPQPSSTRLSHPTQEATPTNPDQNPDPLHLTTTPG